MIIDLIKEIVKQHLQLDTATSDTVVFGVESSLDSLGLVSLLADIEQEVYEQFQVDIIIASERAMSQKRSPFNTVQSLADFVETLVEEQK